jgi:hypothetical protein
MTEDVVQCGPEELSKIVEKKATCPFIGTAVATGNLLVRNDCSNPLASVEDVRALGNKGGGDLGDVLVLFANGNHAFMRGPDAHLNQAVPFGLFSLEFPGSQGSHPGHSRILQGDPGGLDSGRLSDADFQRLAAHASNGLIKRSDVGKFIAENLHRDPKSKVFGVMAAQRLAVDLALLVGSVRDALLELHSPAGAPTSSHRETAQKFTKLLGEDNLVGSSGEFGLLFAFLANSPLTKEVHGEPALSMKDIESMFLKKCFPKEWESWKKTRADWVTNTAGLMLSAGKAYLAV